jgi:Tfp pilus assembly protein PilF
MLKATQRVAVMVALLLGATQWVQAAVEGQHMKADLVKVKAWNGFADALYAVHQQRSQGKDIRTEESEGGYAGMPKYYREVNYFDRGNGQKLTNIQWERERPQLVHAIELYIYDAQGRVLRDYYARYLPIYRNAPVQTLINFHQYHDALHGYRQFDASGDRLYEQCTGNYQGKDIFLSIDEGNLPSAAAIQSNSAQLPGAYTACFGGLPLEAGKYRDPKNEIAVVSNKAMIDPILAYQEPDTIEQARTLVEKFSTQIRADNHNAQALLQRGHVYFVMHETDNAIDDLDRAITIDKELADAYFWRGMARGHAQRIEEGIADLSVYLRHHPTSTVAHTKRGVRYLWLGDEQHAEQDLRKAIALHQDNAEAHDDLGVILARRGEHAQAISHFQTTVRVDPTYQKGFHNLAMVQYITGDNAAALQTINSALALLADARDSLLLKAEILTAQGQAAEADKIKNQAEFLPEGNWSERISVK